MSIFEADDGSLYIAFVRDRRDVSEISERRVSYHTSGRVNPHGFGGGPALFFEPLVDVTQRNLFAFISIPDLSRLDEQQGGTDLNVLEFVTHRGGRVTFSMIVLPIGDDLSGLGAVARLEYSTYAVAICLEDVQFDPALQDHFIYGCARSGLYSEQKIGRLEAELAYVQHGHGQSLIVHPPNANGIYTLYPSVVMRDTPRLRVTFASHGYEVVVVDGSRANRIRFRIKRKDGFVKVHDLREIIASIELDAEL